MGICETPHDLRPEHAALPALLVAARAGDGCAGGGGGGMHGRFLNKQKRNAGKKYPVMGSNCTHATLESKTQRIYQLVYTPY